MSPQGGPVLMTIVALFLLYVAGSGIIIQLIDMTSIYRHT
jgi:hypothetical protein